MNQKTPHSGQGLTGTALGALGILLFLTIVAIGLISKLNNNLTDAVKSLMVILVLVDIAILVLGTALSTHGVLNKERSKLFGVVGLILNLILLIPLLFITLVWLLKLLF
jgi:hypothetical protein